MNLRVGPGPGSICAPRHDIRKYFSHFRLKETVFLLFADSGFLEQTFPTTFVAWPGPVSAEQRAIGAMKADWVSIGRAGIGAGFRLPRPLAFAPDKAIHFQYTGGPQSAARGA
jgi:hypothetical protein